MAIYWRHTPWCHGRCPEQKLRSTASCQVQSTQLQPGIWSRTFWDDLRLFGAVLSVAVFHTCDTPAHCWPLVPVIAGAHVAWEPKTWLAKKTVARSYWQLVKLASMLLTQWICRRLNFWMTFHLVYILAQTIGRNCRRNITGWLPRNGLANSQRWSLYLSIKVLEFPVDPGYLLRVSSYV